MGLQVGQRAMGLRDQYEIVEMFRDQIPGYRAGYASFRPELRFGKHGKGFPLLMPFPFAIIEKRRWKFRTGQPEVWSEDYVGRGWRERLVNDVIRAIESGLGLGGD